MNTELPAGLTYWTADTVAECLPYDEHLGADAAAELYRKLWSVVAAAENPTPLGGDGSDGTVEYPEARLSLENDDKGPAWWAALTEPERAAVAAAYAAEYAAYADLTLEEGAR